MGKHSLFVTLTLMKFPHMKILIREQLSEDIVNPPGREILLLVVRKTLFLVWLA